MASIVKSQAPNPKLPTTPKSQLPNQTCRAKASKTPIRLRARPTERPTETRTRNWELLGFGNWKFGLGFGVWEWLGFGAWSLGFETLAQLLNKLLSCTLATAGLAPQSSSTSLGKRRRRSRGRRRHTARTAHPPQSGAARSARRGAGRDASAGDRSDAAAGRCSRGSTRTRSCSRRPINFLSAATRTDPQPVPSEDWLRDNYHVVQDQVREVRQDLPRKFYLELPKLADGPFAGYPRVYLVARELIAHTAGRLDLETLVDFVSAYQRVAPLSIGETLGHPDHAAAGAGRGAAAPGRRRRRRAPQPRTGAQAGTATIAERAPRRRAEISIELLRGRGRQRAAGCRRRSSSSCCSGCAISRRRPRRPGWRCSARSKRRATRPRSCCGVEHQREAADPARDRQRHHAACGCCRRSTGRCSSIASAWSSRSCARIRPAPTRRWTSRRATATGTRSSSWRKRSRSSRSSTSRERAIALARERRSSTIRSNDRRHHVGYYLISRGRFRARAATCGYPPSAARAAGAVRLHAIRRSATSARSRSTTALGVASLLAYARAPRRGAAADVRWSRWSCCFRSASWRSAC